MSGRPTVITDQVVSLLVASFQGGLSVREACWQSGISHEAYYNRNRSDEQFADTMAKAQSEVNIKAKRAIANAVDNGDIGTAKWWLEHKARAEFGKDGMPDEIPQDHCNLKKATVRSIEGLERIICLRYRGLLFLESQQEVAKPLRRGQKDSGKADRLLQLNDAELSNYVDLEEYATGEDKAGVKEWLERRQSMQSDLHNLELEEEI